MRLGLISDLHYRNAVEGTSRNIRREGRRIGELLPRCLDEMRAADVDLLICAGDCLDDETKPGVMEDLASLRTLLVGGGLSYIVIPGNHDPAPEEFYRVLPRPARWQRIGGCDFLTFFDDVSMPEKEQSRRADEVMQEMERRLWAPGPLTFVVQHFVVYPDHEGTGYNHTYENAPQIRALLERSPRKVVSLSGHYHRGHALYEHSGVRYLTARALCEHPYPYYVIDADGKTGEVRVAERAVATAR